MLTRREHWSYVLACVLFVAFTIAAYGSMAYLLIQAAQR